jgi:hypothetical protein
MSLSAKRESLARIHGRYRRAGRLHKTRILDEFCATCGYHRKSALRLLHRPLASLTARARPGPKRTYDPLVLLPVLKVIWLSSDQLCSKLLRAALPEWLEHYECRYPPLAAGVKEKLLAISPAQIDRLLRPARVGQTRKGLGATRPCEDSTAGDYVNSLPFTELFSGWTENRAVWNKSSHAILAQVKALEDRVPFVMTSFHSDNGTEFLNWPLHEYLTGRPLKVPWTRSRAYRKNDNAHCEQKNWTHVRQLLGYERFGHPELVPLLNELYAQEWSQYQNHFRPTFKLEQREKKNGKTVKTYEKKPQTPYQRLLGNDAIPEASKARLREEHQRLDPFALKKSIEGKLKNFFTALGHLNREATKT